jgi:hypothetical protein
MNHVCSSILNANRMQVYAFYGFSYSSGNNATLIFADIRIDLDFLVSWI